MPESFPKHQKAKSIAWLGSLGGIALASCHYVQYRWFYEFSDYWLNTVDLTQQLSKQNILEDNFNYKGFMNNRMFNENKKVEKYFLCEWISSLYHYEFDERHIDPRDTVAAFETMLLQNDVSDAVKQSHKSKGIWDTIEKVRKVLSHSDPKEKLNAIMKDGKISVLTKQEIIIELRDLIQEKITVISARQIRTKSI